MCVTGKRKKRASSKNLAPKCLHRQHFDSDVSQQ